MKTTFKEENQKYVITFEGRLDTAASAQVKKDLEVLENYAGHDFILDCNALEYISSSGLRLFLTVLKNAKSNGSRAAITGLRDDLYEMFDETGFTQLFDIERR